MKATRQVKKVPNPEGKGGFGDHPENINPGGEPKNSLKNYVARKLAAMSPEEKEKWLKEMKISGALQWTMGEGNPDSSVNTDITTKGEKISMGGEEEIKELARLVGEKIKESYAKGDIQKKTAYRGVEAKS